MAISTGSTLYSLMQINRALKAGFVVKAELFLDGCDACVCFDGWYVPSDHYSGCGKPIQLSAHMIRKMTDLPESAYLQLRGMPSDEADQNWSWWEFVAATE